MTDETEPPIYGSGRYDETQFGGIEELGPETPTPWRINNTRLDVLTAPPPPVMPGESATYSAVMLPSDAFVPLQQRFETVRRYFRNGPFVSTFQLQGGECHYREQHSAPDGSQLVYIAPLAAEHDASGTAADPPPERESGFDSRYAVVTGGSQSDTMLPQSAVAIEIETVTIAHGDDFETRDAVRDAREHNGF